MITAKEARNIQVILDPDFYIMQLNSYIEALAGTGGKSACVLVPKEIKEKVIEKIPNDYMIETHNIGDYQTSIIVEWR